MKQNAWQMHKWPNDELFARKTVIRWCFNDSRAFCSAAYYQSRNNAIVPGIKKICLRPLWCGTFFTLFIAVFSIISSNLKKIYFKMSALKNGYEIDGSKTTTNQTFFTFSTPPFYNCLNFRLQKEFVHCTESVACILVHVASYWIIFINWLSILQSCGANAAPAFGRISILIFA